MKDQQKKSLETGPESKERRTALKKMTVGVGVLAGLSVLPEQWTRPIVGQMVLPAHAGTSGSSLFDPCSVALVSGHQTHHDLVIQVDGFVTPPTANLSTQIVATPSPVGDQVVVTTTTGADGSFSSEITLHGPGVENIAVQTTVTGATGSANCSVAIPEPPKKKVTPTTTQHIILRR